MLTSDYRFQGISSSGRDPALQGYVHWWRPDGFYAGVFASQVDYGYASGPSFEVDVYAGKNIRLDKGRTELKLEAMHSLFPDDETWGPTLSFWQVKVAGQRKIGDATLGLSTSYTPEASYQGGSAWLAETQGSYALSPKLKLIGGVGRRWSEQQADRTYWKLGGEYRWKSLTFELRYEGNDLSRAGCGFFASACDDAIVGTITASLPPIM
jgi:uncharacterized protein (TIGR02001 family)